VWAKAGKTTSWAIQAQFYHPITNFAVTVSLVQTCHLLYLCLENYRTAIFGFQADVLAGCFSSDFTAATMASVSILAACSNSSGLPDPGISRRH